jgi:hypothetical protein
MIRPSCFPVALVAPRRARAQCMHHAAARLIIRRPRLPTHANDQLHFVTEKKKADPKKNRSETKLVQGFFRNGTGQDRPVTDCDSKL